ncbi:MAG: hypothetical protein IJW03_01170 [Clostridia bacterium]|nr:hypothetical protein [Clostridia bacterium]
MKRFTRITFALTLILILASMLSGCGLLDRYKKWDGTIVEVTENSKKCVEDFATELSEGDIKGAKAYLHPNSTPSADELEDYIKEIESSHDFSFTDEVSFEFEGFDPEVNLEHVKYDISANVTVGDEVLTLKLGILNDEAGFGIYNITIE